MRLHFLILAVVVSFLSCNQKKEIAPPQSNKALKKTIHTFLDDWHKAASEANFEAYFSKMDSTSVFIGTDASENWTKKQFENFSKPYFDKGEAWNFVALERNIYMNDANNFIWFDELLETWMGTCRGSGVLEKKDRSWKIKQYVLSIEIPNADVQAVILEKRKSDSLFLTRFYK
jgi:hypothetical protein